MSRNTKLILGAVIGFVLLGGCCFCVGAPLAVQAWGPRLADSMVKTEPLEVQAAAAQMFAYDLPPGYSEQMVVDSLGTRTLTISGAIQADSMMMITVTQYTSSLLTPRRPYTNQIPDYGKWLKKFGIDEFEFERVEDQTYTIAGVPVNFMVTDLGVPGEQRMRQMVSDPFAVDDHTYAIQVMGSSGDWDADGLESFLTSIRSSSP